MLERFAPHLTLCLSVCGCVCVCMYVRACAQARLCVCVHMCVRACVCIGTKINLEKFTLYVVNLVSTENIGLCYEIVFWCLQRQLDRNKYKFKE